MIEAAGLTSRSQTKIYMQDAAPILQFRLDAQVGYLDSIALYRSRTNRNVLAKLACSSAFMKTIRL
jgi:hypothetical protein